jgi:hypothetical protein
MVQGRFGGHVPFKAPPGDTSPRSVAADSVCCQDFDFDALPEVVWRAAMLEDRVGELDATEAATVAGALELLGVMRALDVAPTWGKGPDP